MNTLIQNLQSTWHQEIPIPAAMGIEIVEFTGDEFVVHPAESAGMNPDNPVLQRRVVAWDTVESALIIMVAFDSAVQIAVMPNGKAFENNKAPVCTVSHRIVYLPGRRHHFSTGGRRNSVLPCAAGIGSARRRHSRWPKPIPGNRQ